MNGDSRMPSGSADADGSLECEEELDFTGDDEVNFV